MRRGTKPTDPDVPVKLSEHDVAERAETMAAKLIHIGSLRKKRREDLRSINAQIESELDEVQRLARTIMSGIEERKQSSLLATDELVPSQTEATSALAEVVKHVQYHRDGAMCRKDPCKRKHHDPDALRAQGIKLEGDELEEDVRAKCSGCGLVLTATEVVKKLGLCEPCQAQPHEEVELPKTEGSEEAQADA